MDYNVAINQYAATPTVTALRNRLAAKVWPAAGPPQIFIALTPTMAAGSVRAQYSADNYSITVNHGPHPADKDILDSILFEVSNPLNPKLTVALAMPKSDPIDNVGAAHAAAEYDTLKSYVNDLVTAFAGGNPANLAAAMLPGHDLPTQALATITNWINNYVPIYAGFGILPANMFVVQPVAVLLPLPAVAPVPPAAVPANAPVLAEQSAVVRFSSTPHNPGADPAGPSFYLALLTSRQVYTFERPRAWNAGQLATYTQTIGPLMANIPNLLTDVSYKPVRDAWMNADPRCRAYLFTELMVAFHARFPGTVAAHFDLDPATVAVAREEAARGLAARYVSGDMTTVKPLKPWLTTDVPLAARVTVLVAAQIAAEAAARALAGLSPGRPFQLTDVK